VLNEAGISTFILDSFTGRTLYEMAKHRSLPPIVRTLDAFAALQALSTHPFVDGNKISIMGFSHGGVAAMLTNAGRFREAYGNGLRFASHISLYGICSIGYRGEEDVSRPMLIMHGEADDWVPSAPCIDYTDRLKRAGKSIQLITYPDAHHIFDLVPVGTVKRVDFPTPFWCRQLEANAGDIVVVDTGKPLGQEDACWRKTVSFGYNEAATKKAHSDVLAFLKSVVGE
jgi:dienelactone hydrolase